MTYLTIKIEDISEGGQKGFKATIPEIKTVIGADSIAKIFKLIPDAIKTSKKYKPGIFSSDQKKKKLQKLIASTSR